MPTPLTNLKIQTNNGIIDVPIYSVTDMPNSPFRIMTAKGLGCFELGEPTNQTPLRIMTNTGVKGVNLVSTPTTNIIVSDSFNRADATTLGNTETGQVWQWYGTQQWGIQNNQMYPII